MYNFNKLVKKFNEKGIYELGQFELFVLDDSLSLEEESFKLFISDAINETTFISIFVESESVDSICKLVFEDMRSYFLSESNRLKGPNGLVLL